MFRRLFDVAKDRTGAALVEFAVLMPMLLLVFMGLAQFGILFYNYIMVTNAATIGARQLSISYSDTTPYTDTRTLVQSSAAQLSGLTITLAVGGTTCSSDTACYSALQTANTNGQPPNTPIPASVTVSYACAITLMPASWLNMTGVCPLTATIQQPVE
jgi:Flp pilus assembly protein TadG